MKIVHALRLLYFYHYMYMYSINADEGQELILCRVSELGNGHFPSPTSHGGLTCIFQSFGGRGGVANAPHPYLCARAHVT